MVQDELRYLIYKGDRKALEILFELHYEKLCHYANSYTHVNEISEEIVSDVFFQIWKKRLLLKGVSNILAYLYTSTRNSSINYLKKHQVEREDLLALEHLAENTLNKQRALEYEELESFVRSILEELPPQRRLIYTMNKFDGLKYKEIAKLLNISDNTVRNQINAAHKHMTKYQDVLLSLSKVSTCLLFVL